jgi:CDP-glucose 4,6-dehydratase
MIVNGFDWSDRKVLVTGASGFKGSWLCAVLLRLGAQVFGTVRNQRHPLSAHDILDLPRSVINVSVDVSDRQDVYDVLNSVEPHVIFHLAAKALVPVSLRDPRRTFEVNVMGTLNIMEACRKLKLCERLLICSTDHVFGNNEPEDVPAEGFDERSRVSYGGPYDTSKAAMELILRSCHSTYWQELPAIGITRCANVFGLGDTNQRRIVPLFVRSAVDKGVVPLRYRFSGRQFVHVTDAIRGYILSASSLNEGGVATKTTDARPTGRSPFTQTHHFAIERYEGTLTPYITMQRLASEVASLFGAQVDDATCTDYPPNENRVQALNCRLTREALGWQPTRSLSDGLSGLGAWYRAERQRQRLMELIELDLSTIVEGLASSRDVAA